MVRDQTSAPCETRQNPCFRRGAVPSGRIRFRGKVWAQLHARKRAGTRNGDRYKGWLALFDANQVQFLILDSEQDQDLLQAARSNPKWRVDCVDGSSVLLARAGSQ
jgi:hypothetical protein